ncbi:MAG: CoA transferase [Chloroflexi bacterium]|nr:CoA transferase [Chloroflexota bacterium]
MLPTCQRSTELVNDPRLRERGFLVNVDHPATGLGHQPRPGIQFSSTPPRFLPAPLLGEYNQRVFGGLPEMTAEEIEQLVAKGVIYRVKSG